MRKKIGIAIILVFLLASGVFAESRFVPKFELKIGAGGCLTGNFGDGYSWMGNGSELSYLNSYWGGGGFVFFDATYAEIAAGFSFVKYTERGALLHDVSSTQKMMDAGIFAKYPFALGEKMLLFPLTGAVWRFGFSDNTGISSLWIKFGAGLDLTLKGRCFFRGEMLYGIRLPTKTDKEFGDYIDTLYADADEHIGHGPELKLAIGYRF